MSGRDRTGVSYTCCSSESVNKVFPDAYDWLSEQDYFHVSYSCYAFSRCLKGKPSECFDQADAEARREKNNGCKAKEGDERCFMSWFYVFGIELIACIREF